MSDRTCRVRRNFSIQNSQTKTQRHQRPVVIERRGCPFLFFRRYRQCVFDLSRCQLLCSMIAEPFLEAGKARDRSLKPDLSHCPCHGLRGSTSRFV
jgi:hypothetical protein